MRLCIQIDGKLVFTAEVEAIPPAGSTIVFRLQAPYGNYEPDQLVTGRVSYDNPPEFDFDTVSPKLLVTISVLDVRAAWE